LAGAVESVNDRMMRYFLF